MTKPIQPVGRREFVKSSIAGSGLLLVNSGVAFSTHANSFLNLGILGCGRRANHLAGEMIRHTCVQVLALADMFDDCLSRTKEHLDKLQSEKGRSGIARTYRGPKAYLPLLDSDIDAVLIASPPYFHPLHLGAAVDAEKHCYLERPAATDVRGSLEVASLAERVQGHLSVDVGLQMRNGPQFAEMTRRLQAGAIGDLTCAHGVYFAGDFPRRVSPGVSRAESKLRNWVFDRVLSGDILVEQNITVIDAFNWVLKAHPLRAQATGARKVRTDVGNVSDHFIVTFYYPNDVRANFMSIQFLPTAGGVSMRFFGPRGFSEASYTGSARIVGDSPWEALQEEVPAGADPEMSAPAMATTEKIKLFADSILTGHYHNQLRQGVESTLSAILGRESAYLGRELSWGELLASEQQWETDVDFDRL